MQRLCTRFVNPFHGYNLVLYSTSASTDSFANYLVDSLGFSSQQAVSAFKKLSNLRRKVNDSNFHSNAVSVVGFFKSHGFEDTHLRKIVSLCPQLLCSNVNDTLRPKLQLQQDQGVSKSDIIEVVSGNPRLLVSGVESGILPAFQDLRKVMGADASVFAVLKKFRVSASLTKYLMSSIASLTSYGVPIELIRKYIIYQQEAFMRKPEIFNEMVFRVKNKWGICPNSPAFLYCIPLASGLSEEVLESKYLMFKSFGWAQSDIETLMMKNPYCFSRSEAAIKKKLDFLMNELRLEPRYLTSNSVFLNCSLEKRIVPRHKILLVLKEKGLLEKNSSLNTVICMPESRFLKKFVLPFKEIHGIYAELTGCSKEMLTQEIHGI